MTRVACIGDSITRGTFVWRRTKNAYPMQLKGLLGERYDVRGFGANGHAAQKAADRPYRRSDEFVSSTRFQPDIALIMLGTNDCRGDNWQGLEPFMRDYRDLVAHYRSLESGPVVWLLTPPALFCVGRSTKVRYGMDPSALEQICGGIESVAREADCGLIDVHATTALHPEAFRFDGVHPGSAGARLIAEAVYAALVGRL